MISIQQVLENIIKRSPFLETAISQGIINLSALARQIQPEVEEQCKKPVTDSSIMMALKRMSENFSTKQNNLIQPDMSMGNLTVRSQLTEITFQNSPELIHCQAELLQKIKNQQDNFLTITQGVHETTLIISDSLSQTIKKLFQEQKILSEFTNLSSISIKLSQNAVHTPGLHYHILKQLAWEGINIIEEVSTYTEFTIIVKNQQVDEAFRILKRMAE